MGNENSGILPSECANINVSGNIKCTSLINCIDRGLHTMYKGLGLQYVNEDGVGRFAEFCECNGFDDESIAIDLDPQEKDESVLVDFDPEFPFDSTVRTVRARNHFIFDKLFNLYQEHLNGHPNIARNDPIDSKMDKDITAQSEPKKIGIKEDPNKFTVTQSLSKQQRALFAMNDIDPSILCDTKSLCNHYSDGIPITKSCSHSLRICTAMRYFHVLLTSTILNEEEKKELFVDFNQNIYRSLLDDTIHFVQQHDHDIERVRREWTEIYGLPKCSVSECVQTVRHYERGRRERNREWNINEEDAVYNFYEKEMDRVHFYIFHLFDVGMRVNTKSLILSEDEDDEKKLDSVGVSVDKLFAAERDQIKMRRAACKVDCDRFDKEHNKFTIQSGHKHHEMTATDAVFDTLSEKQNVRKEILQQVHQFLVRNGFDSDAIELNLENRTDSNLCTLIQNQTITERIRNFIESINCMFYVLLYRLLCVILLSLSLCVVLSEWKLVFKRIRL